MKKRKNDKNQKPLKINLRLAGAVVILGIFCFLKLNPIYLNSTLSYIFKTNCDFYLLTKDIGKVIRFHTVGYRVFELPVKDVITSPFGKRESPTGGEEEIHTGIDINANENTEVLSSYEGRVFRVEENEFYGKFIMIEHFGGLVSLYGHLNEQRVQVGDIVAKDTVIGLSGSTGRSTGPHLHFEIRKNGECVNPEDYFI